MKNKVIPFPKEEPKTESPFPGSVMYWQPENETISLMVQCPKGMTKIETMDQLISLLAKRLEWTLKSLEYDPKESVAYMMSELNKTEYVEYEPNWTEIQKGSQTEISRLISQFSMKNRMMEIANLKTTDFPLKTIKGQDGVDAITQMSIADWTNEITASYL